MGWGTEFKTEIYLNKQTFTNKFEVEYRIQELCDDIEISREKLLMFASADNMKSIPNDWKEEPIDFIHKLVSETIECLKPLYYELQKLEYYLEYLKENNIEQINKKS